MITNEQAKLIVEEFDIADIVAHREEMDCFEPEVMFALLALVEMANEAKDKP